MRVTVDVEVGAGVRADTQTQPIGRVLGIVDNGISNVERLMLVIDLDDEKIAEMLAEKRDA